ncbi:hypothetical protein Tco_0307321 [Tanacetum coccineum]
MTTLQFADTHNLVAFLSKPAESEGFKQIVDFLNANPIRYALMINPTIYTSCIKQFWATIKGRKRLFWKGHTLISYNDGTRSTRTGSRRPKRKDTEVPQPSGPTDNVPDEAVNEEIDDVTTMT